MNPISIAPQIASHDDAADLAVESLYRFLAALFSDPRARNSWLSIDPAHLTVVRGAADLLRCKYDELRTPLGIGELLTEDLDLTPLLEELGRPDGEIINEYVRVFGLVSCRECPPYETEYSPNEDTFYRAQQLADVSGFYRAFGLQVSSDLRERPDYLPLELEFEAFLLMKARSAEASGASEQSQLCRAARKSFFRDHLSWWVPSFALGVRGKAAGGLYYEAARVLAAILPLERAKFELPAPSLPILQPASDDVSHACEGCALR